MSTKYLYTQEQAAELREKLIANVIFPQVKLVFAKYNQLNSAMFLVAQYWADEASDAVHYQLLLSVLSTPVIPEEDDLDSDPVNLPGLQNSWELLDSLDEDEDELGFYWNDNGDAIAAFAAFCKEDAHQEMDGLEAYSPYAVFRRKESEIEIEIVGEMLRPWADGMRPEEWEEE
ncbi:hypothetical protein [Pseudanabaena sp. PCC 6802]|uniref:hypothetical protein n=1 Tax=Pseudanabaena sp. PCC 6802 TaxID=118173 RepID=UPI000344CBB0|nr:hypothetical protein [Pseudanabaena sp. PCC 6802]